MSNVMRAPSWSRSSAEAGGLAFFQGAKRPARFKPSASLSSRKFGFSSISLSIAVLFRRKSMRTFCALSPEMATIGSASGLLNNPMPPMDRSAVSECSMVVPSRDLRRYRARPFTRLSAIFNVASYGRYTRNASSSTPSIFALNSAVIGRWDARLSPDKVTEPSAILKAALNPVTGPSACGNVEIGPAASSTETRFSL